MKDTGAGATQSFLFDFSRKNQTMASSDTEAGRLTVNRYKNCKHFALTFST
jgi:hypothetical protein